MRRPETTHIPLSSSSGLEWMEPFHVTSPTTDTGMLLLVRLVSMGVILAAGLLGVAPPLLSWVGGSNSTSTRVVRAFSGGTILALALIHIIPEAFEQLEGLLGEYPLGGLSVLAGLVSMIMLEYVATYISMRGARQQEQLLLHYKEEAAAAAPAPALAPAPAAAHVHAHVHLHAHHDGSTTTHSSSSSHHHHNHHTHGGEGHAKSGCTRHISSQGHEAHSHTHASHHTLLQSVAGADDEEAPLLTGFSTSTSTGTGASRSSSTRCVSPRQGSALVPSLTHSRGCRQQPACHISAAKQQVLCITMELGCVVHSITLGVALGVMTDSPRLVLTLMAVLAVHQAIEGLALGAVLAATDGLTFIRKAVLALCYALTLPLGIVAGIAASGGYDAASVAARSVQGVANGVSGGMLLHVSLFSLLGAEFTQHDLLHRPGLAAVMMLAALLGIGGMCVLGIWA